MSPTSPVQLPQNLLSQPCKRGTSKNPYKRPTTRCSVDKSPLSRSLPKRPPPKRRRNRRSPNPNCLRHCQSAISSVLQILSTMSLCRPYLNDDGPVRETVGLEAQLQVVAKSDEPASNSKDHRNREITRQIIHSKMRLIMIISRRRRRITITIAITRTVTPKTMFYFCCEQE